MAATQAVIAAGTSVEYYNGSSWVTAIEPTNIGSVGDVGVTVDATNLASTAREYISGLSDTQETSMTFRLVPGDTDQTALRTRAENQTSTNFRITFPTTPNVIASFTVALTAVRVENPAVDAPLDFVIQGRVSGTTTWT